MSGEEQRMTMGKIVARAWADETFKRQLIANPAKTLQEEGVEVPPGVEVRVVENTDDVFYLVLPERREPGELSESDMLQVAGGGCGGSLADINCNFDSACSHDGYNNGWCLLNKVPS